MESGYVLLNTIVLLLIGIAGAGKTSFCHMLFGEDPPTVRRSTPLAQSSIRAISFFRAAASQMENSICWERVSPRMLNGFIADGIKAFPKMKSAALSSEAMTEEQPLVVDSRSNKQSTEVSTVSLSSVLNDADKSRSLTSVVRTSSSVRPLSDIDQLFELDHVKQLLQLVSQSKGSFEIFRKAWLYISDTGGQPKFHELLPTFVRHVSAVAFFVKLNEKFSSRPMIAYYTGEGTSICEPYQSSQTNLEVIQNCLQAMQTRCIVEGSTECPELFFVGTHRDLESADEPLESKNAQLVKLLRQNDVFAKHLAYYSLGKTDQLIFPVNAKEPSTEDEEVVERFQQSVMENCHERQREIPLKWFVLESLLQELADNGVISYKKCLEVASRLGMDEPRLRAALEYLVQLNMFEFFPDVLSKVVFTTSQVLLTKMTELIEFAHILLNIDQSHSACTSEDQEFRDHGYISEKFLKQKRFSSHYVDGLFEAKDLLKLLENRLVVTKQSKDTYIMTAALPELSSEKVDDHRVTVSQMSTHVPIAVHYPSCLFPIGIFTSLVSHLQTKSSWKILMNNDTGKPECLYKNFIEFVVDTAEVNANVTLIYTHQWIELHACIYGENSQAHILEKMLIDGLKHAAEVQKYSHIVPKLAFFCPGDKGTTQIGVKCQQAYPHFASVVSGKLLQCTQNKRIRYDITEEYHHWNETLTAVCYVVRQKRINTPDSFQSGNCVTSSSLSLPTSSQVIPPVTYMPAQPHQEGNTNIARTKVIPHDLWKLQDIHCSCQITGLNTCIAIIDTGVDTSHPCLIEKFQHGEIGGCNFLQDSESKPEEVHQKWQVNRFDTSEGSHGTHVAAIVGGHDYGVAPHATLYICRVGKGNKILPNLVNEALGHILELIEKGHNNFDIVNMSFNVPGSKEIESKLSRLSDQGVVCIAAAGNDGRSQGGPYFPASDNHVLSVGGLKPQYRESDYNPARGIDVFAPGEDILVDEHDVLEDGSSLASPMVTGFISLLLNYVANVKKSYEDKGIPFSQNVMSEYHNINFLRKLFNTNRLLCDNGSLIGVRKFLEDMIRRPVDSIDGTHMIIKNITEQIPDFTF